MHNNIIIVVHNYIVVTLYILVDTQLILVLSHEIVDVLVIVSVYNLNRQLEIHVHH